MSQVPLPVTSQVIGKSTPKKVPTLKHVEVEKVKQKRQVTLAPEICRILRVDEGSYVAFSVIEGEATVITLTRVDVTNLPGNGIGFIESLAADGQDNG